MRTPEEQSFSIPAETVLDILRDLTVGQRSVETRVELASFLHRTVFPRLGPFAAEIYFRDGDAPMFRAATPETGEGWTPQTIPAAAGPIKKLHAQGRARAWDTEPPPPFLADGPHRRHLLAPIEDGGHLLALLYLGGDSAPFSPFFLAAVETLAATIGSRLKSLTVIHRQTEAMYALAYSEKLRTALYEISEQAHHSVDIAELYSHLHNIIGRLISAENFSIALTEKRDDGRYLTFPYHVDSRDGHLQGSERKLNEKPQLLTSYLIKTRRPLLLTPDNYHRVCREHQLDPGGSEPHSWLGAPFYLDDLAGAVVVQSYSDIVYTEKDKELMAYVARQLGDAIKRKRAVEALKKAKDRAEQAERNKSTFLANMSHEIRTPMNGILGLTDLLLQSDISGHQRGYLELVRSSADRLLKLINDILDFSKIEAGKLELNVAAFSLRHTIADALEILAITAAKKNIALVVDCEEGITDQLMGDADKLNQILINLVGNAIKFTNHGGVTLLVRAARPQNRHGEVELRFQVKDTGIGIPAEELGNVFKSFRQLGTTRDSNHRGTGLGLVIAAELVEMMGGKICVDSAPGVGTSFYFSIRFPLAPTSRQEAHAAEEKSATPQPAELGEKLRVLLVEDEYINRTLAVSLLEREGWVVTVAENGVQALQILEEGAFDVVLMDIQMPEMNGYEATGAIRNREVGRHLPIIAMTAYAVKGDREKCLAAGMDGYISKPIRPERLRGEIEAVLRRQRQKWGGNK